MMLPVDQALVMPCRLCNMHYQLYHCVPALCVRLRNLEWFAATAWNTGREAGLAGDCMSSAVLFGACADFCSAHPTKDASNLGKQKVRIVLQDKVMTRWLRQSHVITVVTHSLFSVRSLT